ncbi:MAG: response regulator [Elusimicrobiota bacterium]
MTKKVVLVVDDDPELAELVRSGLETIDCEVVTAHTGRTAQGILEKTTPDLAVLDVMLPDIDGITLCQEIKHDPKKKDVPVIMMTALSDRTTYHDALLFGATDYIVKPFEMKELLEKVNKALALKDNAKK